jgi:hypothetical protein
MNIHVISDGADGYRLLTPEDEIVGWVRDRVVGVIGFQDEASAASAAVRAFRTIASWLARHALGALPTIDDGKLSVADDGAYMWIVAGQVPVARLVTRTPADFSSRNEHGFEIVLRGSVTDGTVIRAALLAVETVTGPNTSADIAWAATPSVTGSPSAVTRMRIHGPLM